MESTAAAQAQVGAISARPIIGGVFDRVAQRTGVSRTLVRAVTFVAFVALIASPSARPIGIGVAALYAGSAFVLDRAWYRRPLRHMRRDWSPRRDAGAADRLTPELTRRLHEVHVGEFWRWFTTTPKAPKAELRFWCAGYILSALRVPALLRFHVPYLVPYGRVLVYRDWLVFTTEYHSQPGRLPTSASAFGMLALDMWREARRWLSYMRLAICAWEHATKDETQRLRGPLSNPNAFVVPLSSVLDVRYTYRCGTPEIHIRTAEREIVLNPNLALAVCSGFVKSFMAMWPICRPWQPKLLELLVQTAQANRARIEEQTAAAQRNVHVPSV
jgi:hypothetical protein